MQCEHLVFDDDGTGRCVMRNCKRDARRVFPRENGVTHLCGQHYSAQMKTRKIIDDYRSIASNLVKESK